ncbi:MAG: SURF1 family protein [Cocleimonas sp.]
MKIKNYIFAPKLIPTLLAFICVPILIYLGIWQLDRADEKRVIDQGVNDAIAKPALRFNDADLAKLGDEIFRSGTINGYYDIKEQFLLDNRTHEGKPGYHVLSSFLFESNYKLSPSNNSTRYGVLINRGWISYNGTRNNITNIELDKDITEIVGSIKKIPRSIVLKDVAENDSSTALVFKTENKQLEGVSLIQSIQLDRLSKSLNYELLPVMIELDKTANDGFIREWQPYYGSIDKHNAYALQWFAFASILLFLFFKLNIRKR